VTDRIYAYTVVLDRKIREDDAEAITNAMRMIKGVADVTPLVATPSVCFAETQARRELEQKLWAVLRGTP